MDGSPNVAAARALHAALEAGQHGEALRPLFTADVSTVTRPNAIAPHGSVASLEQMLAASSAGARLLEHQRYELLSTIEHGETVICRVRWSGVIRAAAGP